MNTPDWDTLPIQNIPLNRLTWPCHDLNPNHIHPGPDTDLTTGPIHVQALIDGNYFIHDGRHRAARALLAGATTIPAHTHA